MTTVEIIVTVFFIIGNIIGFARAAYACGRERGWHEGYDVAKDVWKRR